MKKKSTKKKKVTILGKTLLSTIATMESLGPIGEEVLRKNGVEKVDENKSYPYEIRNAIYKEVYDRYGNIALVDMGFKNADLIHDQLIKPVIKIAQNEKKGLLAKKKVVNLSSLNRVFKHSTLVANKFIKKVTDGVNVNYGASYEKTDDFEFKIGVTMAMPYFAAPFMSGVHQRRMSEIFGKYYSFDIKYLGEQTTYGYGYSTWYWIIKFIPTVSNYSIYQIVSESEKNINKNLMKVVLSDSFKQNKKIENISRKIAKYIPPQINDALFKGDYDTNIQTKRKKLTIFFSDIKNFTSTSENLQPEDLTRYLNEYFSEMTSIALKYGGTIDKYIGDAMMIFFGDPTSNGDKQDAKDCLEMALSMQKKMKFLQDKWKNQGFSEPFQVRIGINTGYCNVGNFGSNQRLTYTIIGGEVNVTQRLESHADPDGILMSYETYAYTKDIVEVEERQKIKMKGVKREVKCFAVKKRKLSRINESFETKLNKNLKNKNIEKPVNSLEERVIKIEQNMKNVLKKLSKLKL